MTKTKIILQDFIASSELVKLAVIEAVHRYYYDHCFDNRSGKYIGDQHSETVSELHNFLIANNPDWRQQIFKKITERYNTSSEKGIHYACLIESKPKYNFIINHTLEIYNI